MEINYQNPNENYSFKKRYLTQEDLQKLDINLFFPFKDNIADTDFYDYYNDTVNKNNYCGLEFMYQNNCYDLFTWGSNEEINNLISKFQKHCKEVLNFIPICNNF